jgi:hypothetical protein
MTAAPSATPTPTRGRTLTTRFGAVNDRCFLEPTKRLEIFLAGIQKIFPLKCTRKKKKKLNKSPCTSRHARKFDPFSIMHENFHRSYRQGNWGVTVGSRVNFIRAQRILARLEARKLFRPNIFEVERLRTRIRGLRDLRVLGSRIRGSLFETFSDDKGLEFEASKT